MEAVEIQLLPEPAEPLAVPQIDAAARLGISDRTLRRWEARGMIAGKRVGGVKLYSFAKLKELAGVE